MHAHKCMHTHNNKYMHCAHTCVHTHAHIRTHMRIYAHTNTMRYNVYIVIIIPYLHDIFTILPSEMKIQRHKIVMQVFAKVLT